MFAAKEYFDRLCGLILPSFHFIYQYNWLPFCSCPLSSPSVCLSPSLYSQRLLKSITPEPSGNQHRDFIVTNAVWTKPWPGEGATLATQSALFWTNCKTTGQGGYLSPSLPLFAHISYTCFCCLTPSDLVSGGVWWSQAAVDLLSLAHYAVLKELSGLTNPELSFSFFSINILFII